MDAMVHIDGTSPPALAAVERMAAAIARVIKAAHDYRLDPQSTAIALGLLGKTALGAPTTFANCQFTSAPATPSDVHVTSPPRAYTL